ncbi:polysaccharide deacetylase family protein [soil metagenome]
MFYFVRTPGWLKKLYSHCIWSIPVKDKIIYLSFDDGPHPTITPFVLDELKQYNAKATFFCIGKNVLAHAGIYKRIIDEGHAVGNHSHNHLNGWKTPDGQYLDDIAEAKKYIDSNLFRPPYGRISKFQLRQLARPRFNLKAVMWTVLSGDFDTEITPKQCLENVINKCKPGSIVVFHDSEKAAERMRYALSGMLEHYKKEGYRFDKIVL